jgi:hypothetical protein
MFGRPVSGVLVGHNLLAETGEGPGQAHGVTASVIMAGMGVQRGRVVGDVGRGPIENAAFRDQEGNPRPWQKALPIDYATGVAKPDGKYTSIQSIFPTVCSIFGALVPANQLTEFEPVSAVIRKS